jgi:hypothetical protein
MNPREAAQFPGPRRSPFVPAGVVMALVAACDASTTVDLLPDGGGTALGSPGSGGSLAGGAGGAGGAAPSAACSTPSGGAGTLASVVSGLRNRYDFSGTGTALCDLVEGRHGSIRAGAALDGSGTLSLDGVDDYVELPSGMVSRFDSVTLVAWFTWRDNRSWTRVFDFGQTEARDGKPGTATALFFFTPVPSTETASATALSLNGADFVYVIGTNPFPTDSEQQIAVALDASVSPPTLTTYVAGVQEGQKQLLDPKNNQPMALSDLWDQNCWLGQSQQSWDSHMTGVYDEFRIYDHALTQADVQALLDAGPDRP